MIDPRSDLRVGGVTAWIERPQLPDLAGNRILTNENFIAVDAGIDRVLDSDAEALLASFIVDDMKFRLRTRFHRNQIFAVVGAGAAARIAVDDGNFVTGDARSEIEPKD